MDFFGPFNLTSYLTQAKEPRSVELEKWKSNQLTVGKKGEKKGRGLFIFVYLFHRLRCNQSSLHIAKKILAHLCHSHGFLLYV